MDRLALMAIVLAVLVVLLALMLFGWRGRQRRQRGLGQPAPVPAELGDELYSARSLYVATTVAGEPLNRIAIGGLAYRSRATVTVTEQGLVLSIPGQDGIFIPATRVIALERATWTIDRVVEQDGMVMLRWQLQAGDGAHTDVDSYLRFIEPDDSDAFVALVSEQYLHSTTEGGNAQ